MKVRCLILAVVLAGAGFSRTACLGMSLAAQEHKIKNNELPLRKLEPRAFVRAWGMPTYQHM